MRDAKEVVEVYAASTATGDAALSPGAVAKTGNGLLLLVVALLAVLVYFLYGGAVG